MIASFRISFLLFLVLSITTVAHSQKPSKGARGNKTKSAITGNVIDAESELPLEFATITLMNATDSTVVTGGITNEQGAFNVESKPGTYLVKIEFISYQSYFSNNVKIGKDNPVSDLGTISLSTDANLLNTVEVRAEKSQLGIALDKRVFNVGKDLANRGGSASDILDNVPSVNVDIEGNVALRGSGNVRILINGKPSGLVSGNTNGLRSIPASMIDRVEVITNPSARYEAEGMSGIINIILRKEQQKGINGSFEINAGYPTQYGAAINLNYRRKNLNFFTNLGLNQREGPGGGSEYREFTNGDTTEITIQDRDHLRGGLTRNIRLGADYFINEKNILTTSFLWSVSDQNNITNLEYKDFINSLDNPIGIAKRDDNEEEDEDELEYALTYKKIFSKEGHELTADLRYQNNGELERSDYVQSYFNSDNTASGQLDDLQRSLNDEGEKQTIFQLDYIHPFSKDGKFETGVRSSFRRIKNDYLVEEQVKADNEWIALEGLSNEFSYDEDIYAAYGSYGNKVKKISYQVGLRAEYTDIVTDSKEQEQRNPKSYINFFPSINLSYELPKSNAIQLSYSRRIVRPRFRLLNPFSSFSDDRNFRIGNPDLDPEFTDSYELGHIKYWDKGSLASAIFYRYSTDVIERIRVVDSVGISTTIPQNLATRNEYGFEFVISYNPTKWLRLNGDVNLLRSIINGENLGQNFNADTYTMNGRIVAKVTVFKSVDTQISYNYRAPRKTTQGNREAIHSMDIGISKDVLKNNGTITFNVRDLFNSRRWIYTTELDNLYADGDFQWRARSFNVTFNYRLNQKKQRGRGGRGGGGGDGDF